MPNYERLEQLNRLRESGALTQEEFDREKAVILNAKGKGSQTGRKIIVAGVVLSAIAAIVVLFSRNVLLPQRSNERQAMADTSAPGTEKVESATTENASAKLATQSEIAPTATLDWAFNDQVIGLNPAYVERKLGPPKSKSTTYWEFDVQGCDVTYTVSGTEITSASAYPKTGCSPKVMGRTITARTTFAQVRGANDIIRAACISNCGNAADPTMELYQRGFHANQFIDVVYQSSVGEPQIKAMDLWIAAIRVAHGNTAEDYDGDNYEWFQCVFTPPASVVKAVGPERIFSVTIGRSLTKDGSCRYPS